MSEEYLDVVDEKGNVTGQKELRSIVHEKGLWHRVVHIFVVKIVNNKVYFLVHLRSQFKHANPDKWAMQFGGHVKTGDDIEKTLHKEASEEIGIIINPRNVVPAGQFAYNGELNKEYISSFFYKFEGQLQDLKFNDGEVQEVRWLNADEIKNEIINTPDKWANSLGSFEFVISIVPFGLEN